MTNQESFDKWVSQFDTTGDRYLDMGADEYFAAGYDSRQPEIDALKAENEKLRKDAEKVCRAAEGLQNAVNKLWEAEYPDESDNANPAMDIDDAREFHTDSWKELNTAIHYMRKNAAMIAPDTKGE